MDALVSTLWLAEHLGDRDLRIVDASWHLPAAKRDARAEFAAAHIPGARFFDIDAISDRMTTLPHMLPGAAEFAAAMEGLGISDDSLFVAYDAYGLMSAPRAWWMLRVFGHDRVAVLDGGLPAWKREGRPLTSAIAPAPPARFTARFRPELVRDKAAMMRHLADPRAQLVDARSPGRFAGSEPEPRPGLRGGHIPGARNVPFTRMVDPANLTVLGAAELTRVFRDADIDSSRPTIASCGSGITACALALGLYLAGNRDVAVYDGSWAEWGEPGNTPIERG